jgi:hypothetical protein
MVPETASTTDVCPARAAHGALAVRLVHVTPAAERARARPVAANATAHAAADARRGPSYKYQKSPPCDGRARTAPLATHARNCNPMESHNYTHMRSQRHAYTHAHTARAQMDTNTHMSTRSLHAHAQCTRTLAHRRPPSRTQHTSVPP